MADFESEVRKLLIAFHLSQGHDRAHRGVALEVAKCPDPACLHYSRLFDAHFSAATERSTPHPSVDQVTDVEGGQ